MKIVWSPTALSQLDEIYDIIATERNIATATFAEPPVLVPGARNWPKITVQIGEQVAFEGVYAVGEQRE